MDKKIRLGYDETDYEIEVEIYGEKYTIQRNEIDEIELDKVKENKKGLNEIIDKILGQGSSERINAKRISDGYPEMDTSVALTIISFVVDKYVTYFTSSFDKLGNSVKNVYSKTENKINGYKNRNRKRSRRY